MIKLDNLPLELWSIPIFILTRVGYCRIIGVRGKILVTDSIRYKFDGSVFYHD